MKQLLTGLDHRVLFMCGAAAMLAALLLLLPAGKTEQAQPQTIDTAEEVFVYEQQMEQRLSQLLSQIDGAGTVEVMVTVAASESYEYAANAMLSEGYDSTANATRQESKTEQSILIIDGEAGDEAVVVAKYLPQIMGVAVICEGADNIYVKQSMIEAVSILCGISSNKISVCKKVIPPQQPCASKAPAESGSP